MKPARALGLIAAAGVLAAVVLLAAHGLQRPAAAQLGGYSEVKRLEIRYEPEGDAVEARFHLASGIAVGDRAGSDAAADRLFQAAQVYARGNARMFVSVRSDRVESWTLSVP